MTKEELEKENAELKKDRDYFSGALDKQVEATMELQKKYQELEAQIEKMKCCGNCKYFRFVNGAEYYTCIKDGKRNGEDYRSCGFNLEKWELWV